MFDMQQGAAVFLDCGWKADSDYNLRAKSLPPFSFSASLDKIELDKDLKREFIIIINPSSCYVVFETHRQEDDSIKVSQTAYSKKILKRFNMKNRREFKRRESQKVKTMLRYLKGTIKE
ncbi:hypothetical protein CEXT_464081 [Caerostris extrusa]|uniref:Uncharacterized protein n=1 Tax=Caerostris extrusa TaxID=172846 RepID=A0AAV4UQK3_CAEEX|nr:hypothetical protein CEXT_464081 [Caerostris extrusa]